MKSTKLRLKTLFRKKRPRGSVRLLVTVVAKRFSPPQLPHAMTGSSGTVRFSKVVEATGKPSVHLLWVDPAKDAILQKAIRTNRVMTIVQRPADAKTDYGAVGFQKIASGQILIFPKSLKQFSDKRVIGVKYDLLEWPTIPKNQQAPQVRLARRPAGRTRKNFDLPAAPAKELRELPAPRVVKFPDPGPEGENGVQAEIEEIKDQVRHAMKALEEGKQVAAFNVLKRIVDS